MIWDVTQIVWDFTAWSLFTVALRSCGLGQRETVFDGYLDY